MTLRLSKLQEHLATTVLYLNAEDFLAQGLMQPDAAKALTVLLKAEFPKEFEDMEITKSMIGRLWSPSENANVKRPAWGKGAGSKKKSRNLRADLDVLIQVMKQITRKLEIQLPEPLQSQTKAIEADRVAREAKRAEPVEIVGEELPPSPSAPAVEPRRTEFGTPQASTR